MQKPKKNEAPQVTINAFNNMSPTQENPKTKTNNSTNFSYIEWENHTYRKTNSKNNAKVALSRKIMKFDGHKPDILV